MRDPTQTLAEIRIEKKGVLQSDCQNHLRTSPATPDPSLRRSFINLNQLAQVSLSPAITDSSAGDSLRLLLLSVTAQLGTPSPEGPSALTGGPVLGSEVGSLPYWGWDAPQRWKGEGKTTCQAPVTNVSSPKVTLEHAMVPCCDFKKKD